MNATIFEEFLQKVDLNKYRIKYQPIKLVEMDMPRNIQALDALYEVYWTQRRVLGFEDFYEYYKNSCTKEIEGFRQKTTMCSECFYRGLPARIYRTWASIITQIHAGYVAEQVFGSGSVSMSTELDHKGIDFSAQVDGTYLYYQVKKATHSREVRVSKKVDSQNIDIILIEYEVPGAAVFAAPYKRDGAYKAAYSRFIQNKSIKRLPNGFVVFTPYMFEQKKAELLAGGGASYKAFR